MTNEAADRIKGRVYSAVALGNELRASNFLLALMAAAAEERLRILSEIAEGFDHFRARATTLTRERDDLQITVGELEGAWKWLSGRTSLSLDYDWPDESDDGEWRVHRVSGSVNDREWQLVGSGETALEAVREARALLTPPLELGK